MKKTPLLILLALLAVCVPTAAYLLLNTPKRFTPQNELVGKKLITGLTSTAVAEVRIADANGEVVLTKKDGNWVVPSRGDYPIDNEKEIERLVASLSSLQVGLEIPAESRHFAEMGLLSPDEKEQIEAWKESEKKRGEENPSEPTGLRVTLKDASGTVLTDLVIGEDFGGDPDQPIRGLVLRALSGNKGIWKVVGNLNRRTGELGGTDVRRGLLSDTKAWLAYDFIEVEKIKSISLTAPNDPEFTPWTVTRDSEDGDFTLTGLGADEEMNTGTAGALKNLFSKLRFEDVLDPAKAAEKKDPAGERVAVITTFEDFTYTFNLAPMKQEKKEGEDNDDSSPDAPNNYIGTVKVEGAFKETRDKVEGETEERAKAEDQAHAVRLENRKDKLAREKVYESRTYEFANFSVSSLLKTRADLVQEKTPEAPPSPDATPGAANPPNGFPGGPPAPNRPRTAVSPPVAIPRATTPPVQVPKPDPAPETPAPAPETPAPAPETPAPAPETPAPAPETPAPAPETPAPAPDPSPDPE